MKHLSNNITNGGFLFRNIFVQACWMYVTRLLCLHVSPKFVKLTKQRIKIYIMLNLPKMHDMTDKVMI